MKRYEKFVLEVEEGITFAIQEGTRGELIIRAINTSATNVYSTNYDNPPIPKGYTYLCGKWNNGFVIQKDFDGSQFVWIPVGSLDSNGTLDGKNFSEKFGRRNYRYREISDNEFQKVLNGELYEQLESVKKYGGFYISRYNISKNSEGKPQSVKGEMPWVNVNFHEAKQIASTIENSEAVKSHLIFGEEYDSVLEWFIKTKVKTLDEIARDSSKWGNYLTRDNTRCTVVRTGIKKWSVNKICDLAGNVMEWTQEKDYRRSYFVYRGGYAAIWGDVLPAAYRHYECATEKNEIIGFRAALYIK